MIAGMDPLRDDSLALARALKVKGAAVAVDLHEHEAHGFLQDGRTRARVDSSLAGLAAWMRTVVLRGRR
jgi:acetyl esterase/lipase